MATSTLLQIKKKVRRLTASPDPTQLTDADIEEYVDCFYEQDLPAHLKTWKLRDKYTFFTEPNEDTYTIDDDAQLTLQPPLYIDGNEGFYTQGQAEFFRLYPKQNFEEDLGSGNGGTGYTFTISKTPMLKRQVTITAIDTSGNQLVLEDTAGTVDGSGLGVLSDPAGGSSTGTVNYTSGALSLTWSAAIPTTSTIYARVVPYVAARPRTMLYFNNTVQLRPVPDKAYKVEIDQYKTPTQLLSSDASVPELNQWWQLIAFGAAKKVLEDRQDMESLKNIYPAFDEQMQLVLQRTVKQQTQQRVATIYTEQANGYPDHLGYWG